MEQTGNTWCVCFSPTGSTEKAVRAVAEGKSIHIPANRGYEYIDANRPKVRSLAYNFSSEDFVVLGTPTYAGRVPNRIMPFFRDNIKGNQTKAVIVVTYGNRSYDDCLMEMILMAEANGFLVTGAAAVPCEHAFAPALATGRPDFEDLQKLHELGNMAGKQLNNDVFLRRNIISGNNPVGPYYVPKKPNGEPAKFLKAKPVTDTEKCIRCGFCWENCVMESIEQGVPENVSGVCIKCQRCVKKCPKGAKYFDDEDFIQHKQMLEENFASKDEGSRKEIEIYF